MNTAERRKKRLETKYVQEILWLWQESVTTINLEEENNEQ